uniref:Uncharacterized protein n=1 Tax=Aegilops tauschii subsp. strangulata TaxID=200361 RepID=A0A453GGW8_AEGTS
MDTAAAARRHPALGGRRRRGRGGVAPVRCSGSPAQEFAALASVFRRRLVVGASTAAAAAVGANFGGVTSFLLGLSPELGRSLRLDVLYPVGGFTRCLDSDSGFGTTNNLLPLLLINSWLSKLSCCHEFSSPQWVEPLLLIHRAILLILPSSKLPDARPVGHTL